MLSSKHYIEYILYSRNISHLTDLLLSDLTVLLASDKSDNAFSKALSRIYSIFYGYQLFDWSIAIRPDGSASIRLLINLIMLSSNWHYIEYILHSMDISHSSDLSLLDLTALLASDKFGIAFFKALFRIYSIFYGYQSFD